MKIAIVHDWLTMYAGSERVVAELLAMWPEADLFSTIDFLSDEDRRHFQGKRARTTFAQKLPGVRTRYAKYLPLLQLAIEQVDVTDYDLVISSSHSVAKGVLTGPDQVHLSYVHSPMRYAWDLQHRYLQEAHLTRGPKAMLARALLHYARLWDTRTSNGVDHFAANSNFIARRIFKCYGRAAEVIHPPVDIDAFELCERKDDFYVVVSRMVPYKRVNAVVQAFGQLPDRKLVVIGDGPDAAAIRASASANVEFLGHASDAVLRDHVRRARAFVFAAQEDFGIALVEAQAAGTPVITYGRGGAQDIVVTQGKHPTGLLFDPGTPADIAAAIRAFERNPERFSPQACRANAERFSRKRFRSRFGTFVKAALSSAPGHHPSAVLAAVDEPAVNRPAQLPIGS